MIEAACIHYYLSRHDGHLGSPSYAYVASSQPDTVHTEDFPHFSELLITQGLQRCRVDAGRLLSQRDMESHLSDYSLPCACGRTDDHVVAG